jgi:hypothetical protein
MLYAMISHGFEQIECTGNIVAIIFAGICYRFGHIILFIKQVIRLSVFR